MRGEILVYRPDHPLANKFGHINIKLLDPHEAELAVNGPKHVAIVGDSHYDGIRSPIDNADISSRKKRREYMKLHGLADYDDFKGTWDKAEKERTAVRSGHFQTKERTEAINKAWYDVVEKGRKPEVQRAQVVGDVSEPIIAVDTLPKDTVVRLKEDE